MVVSAIVERVRAAIDELMANGTSFLGASEDAQNLVGVIKDKIPYALEWVLVNAPVELLDVAGVTGADTYVSGTFEIDANTQVATAKLSDDVLRVVSARLSSWTYSPVPVTEHSVEYLMQSDETARGSWDRPVTAIVHKITAGSDNSLVSGKWLELYCAKATTDTLSVLAYKKPDLSGMVDSTDIDISAALEGAFIYHIAGLTLLAFRDAAAKDMLEVARQYLVHSL